MRLPPVAVAAADDVQRSTRACSTAATSSAPVWERVSRRGSAAVTSSPWASARRRARVSAPKAGDDSICAQEDSGNPPPAASARSHRGAAAMCAMVSYSAARVRIDDASSCSLWSSPSGPRSGG